jgi:hypothetical protein
MWLIGTEQGLLLSVNDRDRVGAGGRADVIMDFGGDFGDRSR